MNNTENKQPLRVGTCEMCGKHNTELRILILHEYIGWTCRTCIDQVYQSTQRMYVSSGEESEPAE